MDPRRQGRDHPRRSNRCRQCRRHHGRPVGPDRATILYPGSPFRGTRVTGNLDYDEDIDKSPNKQWITVGSTRGLDALTPMTRIVRQNFLPVYVGAAVYDQYADGQVRNVSNQNWAVAVEDDLNRENGIPLFVQDDPTTPGVDEGDGWISRSMPSWNPDGTAVTFWESRQRRRARNRADAITTGHRQPEVHDQRRAGRGYGDSVQPVGVPGAGHLRRQDDAAAADRNLQRRGRRYRGGQRGHRLGDVPNDPHGDVHKLRQRGRNDPQWHRDRNYGPSQTSVTYLAHIDVTDATEPTGAAWTPTPWSPCCPPKR